MEVLDIWRGNNADFDVNVTTTAAVIVDPATYKNYKAVGIINNGGSAVFVKPVTATSTIATRVTAAKSFMVDDGEYAIFPTSCAIAAIAGSTVAITVVLFG